MEAGPHNTAASEAKPNPRFFSPFDGVASLAWTRYNPRWLTVSKPIQKRRVAKKSTKRSKKSTAHARQRSTSVEKPSSKHEAAYIETLIETGEAAPLTKDGKLPAGATHVIIEDEQGHVKAVRRRFSIT